MGFAKSTVISNKTRRWSLIESSSDPDAFTVKLLVAKEGDSPLEIFLSDILLILCSKAELYVYALS